MPADAVRGMAWEDFRAALRGLVTEHGAVLVRGFGLAGTADVEGVFRGLSDALMPEREAFAARTVYADGVYSATPWPAGQQMCMHHELSYAAEFPSMMLFACLVAPASGGTTGVADSSAVLEALPPDLVGRFEREGWQLVRTYNDEIGASVADSFGTGDPAAVEAYCRAAGIEFAWQPGGGLRTRQHRRAVLTHPVTGRRCWFNQIAFLNEWTMEPEVRDYLVDVYGPDGLPFTTRFGNGDPIDRDVVELLTGTYEQHTLREPWQAGDMLLVDNIRTAHGRDPFDGPREILVGLGDPVRAGDLR
ncbi:putative SyrP-like protein [Pseudonocardia sp. Ae168_Ps1]|nr:putative SyrP-like protein [Pseudonocardia sp. Ae150A_Ps1]OLL80386.1 putative SyrP-like protein [Pseudonocardia sp. Ae168_Ps1]OLL85486.1 putative SyrP-like protein [Pseudonocardia sp. Ae263_Ps1]OLL94487.1 putative SyrP-like protein [Pseudonocardia sp. Ae356_Ps1]